MRVMILADEVSSLKTPSMAVWMRETSERRKAAEAFWASNAPSDQFTLFTAGPDVSPEKACADVLDMVFLHHPDWTTLEIVGARLAGPLLEALSAVGVKCSDSSTGFIAERLR